MVNWVTDYSAHLLFCCKPGYNQNFDPSLLHYKGWLIFMEMKQKKICFEKKNSKWPTQKNLDFQLPQFSKFFLKISGIGPWVSRIDWCKGHLCGSTYRVERLSDVSSKTGKKCIFSWTYPFFENWCFWKSHFFCFGHFEIFQKNFFLLHSQENQSKFIVQPGWVEILMLTLVYNKRVSVRNNLLHSVCRYFDKRQTLYAKHLKNLTWPIKAMMNSEKQWTFKKFFQTRIPNIWPIGLLWAPYGLENDCTKKVCEKDGWLFATHSSTNSSQTALNIFPKFMILTVIVWKYYNKYKN